MATTTDTQQINTLFQKTDEIPHEADKFYYDSQWSVLTDTATSYPGLQCNYSTYGIRTLWTVPADYIFEIPNSWTSSTGTNVITSTAHNSFAYKTSVLDLVNSIQIQDENGKTLVYDSSIHWINRIRLLMRSKDWFATNQPQLCTSVDSQGGDLTIAGEAGLALRQNYLFNSLPGAVTAGYLNRIDYIPAALLHPFFAALTQPICNMSFRIILTFNSAAAQFIPFCYDPVGGGSATDLPTLTIGSSQTQSSIKLHYRSVTLPPNVYSNALSKMSSGTLTRQFKFLNSFVYQPQQFQNSTATSFTYTIPSITNPRRLWIFGLQAGNAINPRFAELPILTLSNTMIKINGQNLFLNYTPQNPYDYWKLFESQCLGLNNSNYTSPTISYDLFNYGGYRYNVFDLSYAMSKLANPTAAVQIDISSLCAPFIAEAGAFDLYVIAELEATCKTDIGTSSSSIITASNF